MTQPPPREDVILGDLLRALARTPIGAKGPTHPEAPWIVGDDEVTAEEQNEATVRGRDLGLLHAIDMRDGYWFAAGLLGPGRECVRNYGGDVTAWQAARRAAYGGSYVDQRTWLTQGDHGQAVAHSRNVDQRSDEAT